MNKREEIARRVKAAFVGGAALVTAGCASMQNYIEPRVGMNIPVKEQVQDYPVVPKIGLAYGIILGNEAKTAGIGVEAGLDYSYSKGEYIKTHNLSPRFIVSGNFGGKKITVSPFVSLDVLSEFSAIDIPEWGVHDNVSNSTLGIELGVGATLFDRFDVRAGYRFLPGSQNVKGIVDITAGYRFGFGKR